MGGGGKDQNYHLKETNPKTPPKTNQIFKSDPQLQPNTPHPKNLYKSRRKKPLKIPPAAQELFTEKQESNKDPNSEPQYPAGPTIKKKQDEHQNTTNNSQAKKIAMDSPQNIQLIEPNKKSHQHQHPLNLPQTKLKREIFQPTTHHRPQNPSLKKNAGFP